MDMFVVQPSTAVTFRSPLSTRIGHTFWTVCVAFLLAVIGFCSIVGIFVLQSNGGAPPMLAVWIGVPAGLAVGAIGSVSYRRVLPTILRLHADGLSIGGRLLGREIAYDDVRLIKINETDRRTSPRGIVRIRATRGPEYTFWLSSADAEECFNAIRGLCQHVAALGPDDHVQASPGGVEVPAVRDALREEYRRRAVRSFAGAIGLLVMTGFFGWLLLSGNLSSFSHTKTLVLVVVLPIASVALLIKSATERRRAREFRS